MWKIRYDCNRPLISKYLSGSYLSERDAKRELVKWLKQKYKAPLKPKFKYKPRGRPTKAKVYSKSSTPGYTPPKYKTPEQIQQMREEYQQWQKQNRSAL